MGKLGGVFDDGKIRTGTRSGPSMWDVRFKNGIGYMSPVFGGLQVILAWQTPEDKMENSGTRFRPIAFDSEVKYVNGRWLAGVGYGKLSERNETGFPGFGPGGLAGLGLMKNLMNCVSQASMRAPSSVCVPSLDRRQPKAAWEKSSKTPGVLVQRIR